MALLPKLVRQCGALASVVALSTPAAATPLLAVASGGGLPVTYVSQVATQEETRRAYLRCVEGVRSMPNRSFPREVRRCRGKHRTIR